MSSEFLYWILITVGLVAFFAAPAFISNSKERFEDWRKGKRDLATPPWIEPRTIYSNQIVAYQALMQRLELIEDRSTQGYDGLLQYLRDTETSQLWVHAFFEPNMSQMNRLDPIDSIPEEGT